MRKLRILVKVEDGDDIEVAYFGGERKRERRRKREKDEREMRQMRRRRNFEESLSRDTQDTEREREMKIPETLGCEILGIKFALYLQLIRVHVTWYSNIAVLQLTPQVRPFSFPSCSCLQR